MMHFYIHESLCLVFTKYSHIHYFIHHSYAQGGDEEFWSKLSPEEQVKTRELLAKIKEGKKGEATSTTSELVNNQDTNVQNEAVEKKKEVSMFSDYDD